jgi:hypothetical protein
MGYAMEDMLVALNAAEWQTTAPVTKQPLNRHVNRKLQLRAQVQELIDVYSLHTLLGQHTQNGMLMDALCLAVKQLLGLHGCWLLNGTMVMGASQTRNDQPLALLSTLADLKTDAIAPDHPVWKALRQTGIAFGYMAPCPLFRETGGVLLMRSAKPLPKAVVNGFAGVLSANIQLQHQLWQLAEYFEQATEAQLQHYRTELTEWILTLVERQTELVQHLSQFVSQRNGLNSNHPLRVAALCQQLATRLQWSDELVEAMALAGFQTTLEGVQWSNTLQDGSRTWADQDHQLAKAQGTAGLLMLSQFFPLVDWPAQQWTAQCHPARLVSMVREFCALTETRHYRKVTKSARQVEQALSRLAHKYPEEWLTELSELAKQQPV